MPGVTITDVPPVSIGDLVIRLAHGHNVQFQRRTCAVGAITSEVKIGYPLTGSRTGLPTSSLSVSLCTKATIGSATQVLLTHIPLAAANTTIQVLVLEIGRAVLNRNLMPQAGDNDAFGTALVANDIAAMLLNLATASFINTRPEPVQQSTQTKIA